MGQCIPQKVLPTRRNLPWINHSLVTIMRRRNKLFKKCKLSGSPTALRIYKYTRYKVTAELRKAKRAFLNKLNNADSKSKQETNIPCLESPTTGSVTDSHQKANLLNSKISITTTSHHTSQLSFLLTLPTFLMSSSVQRKKLSCT